MLEKFCSYCGQVLADPVCSHAVEQATSDSEFYRVVVLLILLVFVGGFAFFYRSFNF